MRFRLAILFALFSVAGLACSAEQAVSDSCSDDSQCRDDQVCRQAQCRNVCNSRAECLFVEICFQGYCIPEPQFSDASLADLEGRDATVMDAMANDAEHGGDARSADHPYLDAPGDELAPIVDAAENEAAAPVDAGPRDLVQIADARLDATTAADALPVDAFAVDANPLSDSAVDAAQGNDRGYRDHPARDLPFWEMDAGFVPDSSLPDHLPQDRMLPDVNLADLSLPDLVGVDLDLVLDGECQGFPRDQVISGVVRVYSDQDLAALVDIACIDGDFIIRDGVSDLAHWLDKLQKISGRIELKNNPSISQIILPQLSSLGRDFYFEDNSALTTIQLPALTTARTIRIRDCEALVDLHCDALTKVTGVDIYRNSSLQQLSMPLLSWVQGNFEIQQCSSLMALNFAGLARVDNNFEISNNPALPNCEAILLRDQVTNRGVIAGLISINGNNDPCEPNPCVDLGENCAEDCAESQFFICSNP